MSRQIKFRGRDIKSGDWVYGDLIHGVGAKDGRIYILPIQINLAVVKNCHHLDGVEVDPESVGQLASTPFEFGERVEEYVGDIVNYDCNDEQVRAVVVEKESEGEDMWISGFEYKFICHEEERRKDGLGEDFGYMRIGNIYEHPELLNP